MESVNSTGQALNSSMSSQSSMERRPLENGTVENGHHSSSKGEGERHKHSSKDKHHSSSKDKHHSSSSSKHHSSSKDKHHSSSSSKDKDRHQSSKHSSSSSSKHKDGHSSSKHKDGHHSSSSKNKDGSSSSSKHRDDKHKHKDGSSKHKDGSSSSSKHKDGSSSSSKHHDDKHKHSSSDKHKSSSGKRHSNEMKIKSETIEMKVISETVEVKMEPPETPAKNGMEFSPPKVKPMIKDEDSDDDLPLTARFDTQPLKRPVESDDEDEPLLAKMEKKVKKEDKSPGKRKKSEDDEDEYAPEKKKKKKDKEGKKKGKAVKKEAVKKEAEKKAVMAKGDTNKMPKKKGKKEPKEEEEKYKWWEELGKKNDGSKWQFLEHQGPVFAPDYEPLPNNVKFYYNGKVMKLSPETEEVATFYGRMLDHDYTAKDIFNNNFFKDWRKVMTSEEKSIITDLSKCNFKEINVYYKEQSEARKNASKEEKNKIKAQNAKIQEEYGFCTMDEHKEKIGNFRIEPPGLFRGRGTHPKMGMLKKRVMPEEVIINCSKNAKVPDPPEGHRWKEVRHDNTVTWLACWSENIQGATKYVMLNAASRLKGEKDWQKYETARKLHKCVDKIRASYHDDWKSKEMRIRQRSVALYFIDKLALRAGNEKDEETADTVGCCSLRVEHLTLHEKMDDQENVVVFDFLGKDSIRYYNKVSVEKRVFKNLQLFMQNKAKEDDVFDRLNTAILNKHLQGLMDGLTAKVFRTFNASKTLQEQLKLLTSPDDSVPAKLLSYNRANRAVAVLCNHQRAVPKNFDKQMENLQTKIDSKKDQISLAKKDVKAAKADYKATKTEKARKMVEAKKKAVERFEDQLVKLEVQATDKDENKDIALGTSKLNYLDPRISVAWCKKWDVPIEKIYNKTQRDKFAWAIEMTEEDFEF